LGDLLKPSRHPPDSGSDRNGNDLELDRLVFAGFFHLPETVTSRGVPDTSGAVNRNHGTSPVEWKDVGSIPLGMMGYFT